MKKGIDISKHQGDVDFTKVKKDGVEFVILRSGYGRYIEDNRFEENVKKAKAAGVPILGVYHFSYALNAEHAKIEARSCMDHVEKVGLDKNTIIFFDFEYDTIRYAKDQGVNLTRVECNECTKAFCEEVEAKGYKAGVYYNVDYYNNWYDHDLLDKYIKWLADWTGDADHKCAFHQYTSKGRVDGIRGNVDMNYYFEEEVKVEEPAPISPKKTVEEIAKEVIQGKWGVGTDRKNRLKKAGYSYDEVQTKVNELLSPKKPTPKPAKKTIEEIAKEVIDGKWGNGAERKNRLTAAGYNYAEVQAKVNEIVTGKKPAPKKKSVDEIAREVIAGKWGNGSARKKALTNAGYDYSAVQKRVNELM